MQFNYEELNAAAVSHSKRESKDAEVKEVSPEEWSAMTPRQKKLFELQMKVVCSVIHTIGRVC